MNGSVNSGIQPCQCQAVMQIFEDPRRTEVNLIDRARGSAAGFLDFYAAV